MLVCDGHYYAVGDEEYGADAEGEEEAVPRKMDWVAGGKGLVSGMDDGM